MEEPPIFVAIGPESSLPLIALLAAGIRMFTDVGVKYEDEARAAPNEADRARLRRASKAALGIAVLGFTELHHSENSAAAIRRLDLDRAAEQFLALAANAPEFEVLSHFFKGHAAFAGSRPMGGA